MRLQMNEIGGGRVTRGFRTAGTWIPAGTDLAPEFLLAMPRANLTAMIGKNIEVWPKPAAAVSPPVEAGRSRAAERHVVTLGFGNFNVIEGRLLNEQPLTKDEAYALAGKEPKKKK